MFRNGCNAGGVDELRLWKDNNADGFIDGLQQTLLAGGSVNNPQGLAVDSATGRVFVSGQGAGDSVVLFYDDVDGNKLVDTPSVDPPYIEEQEVVGDLGADDIEFLGLHFVSKARKLLILTDEILPDEESRLIACADDDPDLYIVPESVGIFFDPVPEVAHSIYGKQMIAGPVVAWVTLVDFLSEEYTDQDGDCAAESEILISVPNAAERAADRPDFIICTVVFTAPANRTGLDLLRVDPRCPLGVGKAWPPGIVGCTFEAENTQMWTLHSEWTADYCPDNDSGFARGFLQVGDQPATAVVLWSDNVARPTQIRGRALLRWMSGPDLAYCCHEALDHSTRYEYEATVNYGAGGWQIGGGPIHGGTFHEQSGTCWWEGKPQDIKKEWNPFGWANQAPFVNFNVSVNPQRNVHTRTNGGRSYKETAHQLVQVAIFCRPI